MVNMKTFLIFLGATFLGTLAAMLVWTLIIKQQVQATANANPFLTALTSL
jgi:hypothetical protein